MPLAWWILNYAKYDPGFEPEKDGSGFRNNILNVPDDEIPNFIESIKDDMIDLDDLRRECDDYLDSRNICIFIDFDDKLFIDGMFDIVVFKFRCPSILRMAESVGDIFGVNLRNAE